MRGLFVVWVAVCGVACYHVHYVVPAPAQPFAHSGTNSFFLFGLVGTEEIDVGALCASEIARVHIYQSFLDGFLGTITLGIYTPRSWEVWCAQERP